MAAPGVARDVARDLHAARRGDDVAGVEPVGRVEVVDAEGAVLEGAAVALSVVDDARTRPKFADDERGTRMVQNLTA